MEFHCRLRYSHLPGHEFVRPPFGNETKHAQLLAGQRRVAALRSGEAGFQPPRCLASPGGGQQFTGDAFIAAQRFEHGRIALEMGQGAQSGRCVQHPGEMSPGTRNVAIHARQKRRPEFEPHPVALADCVAAHQRGNPVAQG